MPDMFMSNGYKDILIQQAFGATDESEDYYLILFANNIVISDTTVSGDLTPASFAGYANVSIPRSSLTVLNLIGNVQYLGTTVVPTYTNTGGSDEDVYGWALIGVSSGDLVCSQNFLGAPTTIPPSQTLPIYPFQIGLQSW